MATARKINLSRSKTRPRADWHSGPKEEFPTAPTENLVAGSVVFTPSSGEHFWKRLRSLEVTEILARDIESACEYLEQHGGSATPPKLHDAHRTSAKC